MIPHEHSALSLPVLSQRDQPVQVFPPFHLELDADEGVTEVIERSGGEVVDVQSL